MVTEELYAIIVAAGMAPDHTDLAQLGKAIQSGAIIAAAAAGTADAITASYTPPVAALSNGMTLYVRAGFANATTTPTFTPASGTIASKTIVKGNGLALAGADIAGGGHWIGLQYDATLDKWVLLNPATGVSVSLRQYLSGLQTATNAGSSTTKIDISAGRCRSDDNTADIVIAATITKQLNAAWVAGNNGGLDTGAVAASTGYHIWAIYNPTSGVSDVLFSTSASAPTMPAGYTKKRWIGWIRTDGSSLIRPYIQRGDTFLWKTPGLDVNGATIAQSGGSTFALPVPTGIRVKALVNIEVTGADTGFYAHSPDTDSIVLGSPSAAPTNLAATAVNAASGVDFIAAYLGIWTDGSGQIRVDGHSYSTETVYISVIGWESDRGRND